MSDEQWDSVEEFESFEDAYQRGIREGRRLQGLDNSVRAAEEAIDAQGWRYLDMSGQDAEATSSMRGTSVCARQTLNAMPR